MKKPVHLTVETGAKHYENPTGRLEDSIRIRSAGWGYIYMEITAEGDFLHLPKKSAVQEDFSDGLLNLPLIVLPERLHDGRNFGMVTIRTVRQTLRVPVVLP